MTVVMPVYNGERFLQEAVESVLGQTFRDFELLAVDDGSTDSSVSILEGRDDPRIRVLRQRRMGLVAALNRGVGAAQGRYIARMDADDVSLPMRLERQVRYLDSHPSAGLVAPWASVVDEHGAETGRILLPLRHEDLIRRLLLRNPIKHGSVMLRADSLRRAGAYRPDYGANEDYDLWRRIAQQAGLRALPEVLYSYREHSGGHSRATERDRIEQRERLRDELWREVGPADLGPAELVRRAREYRRLGEDLYAGYLADQRALVREAFARRRRGFGLRTLASVLVLQPTAVGRLGRPARDA